MTAAVPRKLISSFRPHNHPPAFELAEDIEEPQPKPPRYSCRAWSATRSGGRVTQFG